jgi:signal transduction histidine kinase
MISDGRRWLRASAICCVAWFALAGVNAMLMYAQSFGAMSRLLSLRVALVTTLVPVIMGAGVWRMTERYRWRDRNPLEFAGLHAGMAMLYGVLWALWLYAIARAGPRPRMSVDMLTHTVLPAQVVTGILVYAFVATLSYSLRSVVHARRMELALEHAERLRLQANLAALRAHINPHFLFNTLHSVGELLADDPAAARESLERLSEVFRYALRLDRDQVDLVTLEDEWGVIESYLWLEGLRLGRRLRVETAFEDDALACAIPPFTIQPLVENAVRHGIGPKPSGGTLSITARERDGTLLVVVSDDGVGCSPRAATSSRGLGLRSVRQRLAEVYGVGAAVRVECGRAGGTVVTLSIPAAFASSPATTGVQ